MKKTSTLLLSILITVLFFACTKKDESLYVKPLTNSELLRDGSPWILVDTRVKANNGEWSNYFEDIPTCFSDNEISFPTDSTYNITEGNTKCNPNDPDVIRSGRFELRDQETQMFFTDTTIVFNIPPTPNDTMYTYHQEIVLSITADNFIFVNIDTTSVGDIFTTERKYRRK